MKWTFRGETARLHFWVHYNLNRRLVAELEGEIILLGTLRAQERLLSASSTVKAGAGLPHSKWAV